MKLGGALVTSTATELNILDGVASTLTTTELNYLKNVASGGGTSTIQPGKVMLYGSSGEIFTNEVNIDIDDAQSTKATISLTLSHSVTGESTGQNGIGVGIVFNTEDSGGNIQKIGTIESNFKDASSLSKTGEISFKYANGNTATLSTSVTKAAFELENAASVFTIDGTQVLSKTALGTTVKTASGITQLGTLTSLTTTGDVILQGNVLHSANSLFEIKSNSHATVVEDVKITDAVISNVGSLTTTGEGTFSASTPASSASSGAVIVTGGVGIDKALNVNGKIFTNGVEVTTSSDRRYKKDIRSIKNATRLLQQIHAVTYNFKVNEFKERHFPKEKQLGLIAQEVNATFPQAVITAHDDFLYVSYTKLNAVLIEGFKENILKLNSLVKAASINCDSDIHPPFNVIFDQTITEKVIEKLNTYFEMACDLRGIYFYLAVITWCIYFYCILYVGNAY